MRRGRVSGTLALVNKAIELFELPPNATHDEAVAYVHETVERTMRRHAAGQIELSDAELDDFRDYTSGILRLIEQDRHGAANLELPKQQKADHT